MPVRAGIDNIQHGVFLNQEAVSSVVKGGVLFVPTLSAPYQIEKMGKAGGIPAFVVEDNPLEDIEVLLNTEAIRLVMQDGKLVKGEKI